MIKPPSILRLVTLLALTSSLVMEYVAVHRAQDELSLVTAQFREYLAEHPPTSSACPKAT